MHPWSDSEEAMQRIQSNEKELNIQERIFREDARSRTWKCFLSHKRESADLLYGVLLTLPMSSKGTVKGTKVTSYIFPNDKIT